MADTDIKWGGINKLLNKYYSEVTMSQKINIADNLSNMILISNWRCIISESPACGIGKLQDLCPQIPDKDLLQKLITTMLRMIMDQDLVDRAVNLTYCLLFIVTSIPKLMKEWLFLFVLSRYIQYLKSEHISISLFNLRKSKKSVSCDFVPRDKNFASLSYSFLLFLEENLKFLEAINSLLVNKAFCMIRDIMILFARFSTIAYKSMLLIMKIFPLLCPTDGQICKILLLAIVTSKTDLKCICPQKYFQIVDIFFKNIKILNGFKGSDDLYVNKALFSVAMEIIREFENAKTDKQWLCTVCEMVSYIPPTYIDKDILKAVELGMEIVKCYDIIESYLLRVVDLNLSIIVKEFKEAKVEKKSVSPYRIFSLNKNLENISRVWNAILHLAQYADSFVNYSPNEAVEFLHKVVITEARLKAILSLKFYEYNFVNDMTVPVSKIGEYICKISDTSQLNEVYPKLVNLLVDLLYVHGKLVLPYVGKLFMLPWLQQNDGNLQHEFDTATLERCLDGLFNYMVAISEQTHKKHYLTVTVEFIQKIVKMNPSLKNKYLDILPKIVLVTAARGDLSVVRYLVDHIIGIGRERECVEGFERKIMCLISDRCCLQRMCLSWELRCLDCDRTAPKSYIKPVSLGLTGYMSFVTNVYRQQLLTLGPKAEFIAVNLKRYLNHSAQLRMLPFLLPLVDLIISHNKIRDKLVLCIPHVLYNWDESINVDLALYILQKIVDCMFNRTWLESEQKLNWVTFVIKVLVRLIQTNVDVYLVATIKVYLMFCKIYDSQEDNAKEVLDYMAHQHGLTVYEILTENEEVLSKFFVDIIVDNLYKENITMEKSLMFIAKLFGYSAINFLQSNYTAYMISHILLTFNEHQATYFIKELARMLFMSVEDLIISNFHIIFTRIYFNSEIKSTSQALNLSLKLAKHDLKTLIYYSGQKFMCKVLMNFHNPIKVFRFMMFLVDDSSVAMKTLQENVTGVLTFVGSKLTTPGTPRCVIKNCLKVPIYLMKALDTQFLDGMKVKLLSTLRTVLPLYYNSYPHLCMLAWMLFIYRTDLTFLGPNLTTIFLELLKLFSMFPVDVSNIFYFLAVKNKVLFRKYLPALYFVPDHKLEKMHKVWLIIQRSLKRTLPVSEKIRQALGYVNCDYIESRISALNLLQLELTENRDWLHDLALKSETLDPLFEDIVACLMENIQMDNAAVKTACARCLGELGAIDPSRFNLCMEKRLFNSYKIETDEFAYICINSLLKELHRSKKSFFVNSIANTIQELLKLYLKGDEEHKTKFFSRFSVNDRYVLEPLTSTSHNFRAALSLTTLSSEMLNSPLNFQSPLQWAYSWASKLVSILPNGFAKNVFTVCLSCMNMDLLFCEAIFPYIVLEAWKVCPDKCCELLEEGFKCVLKLEPDLHCAISPSKIILRMKSMKKSTLSTNRDTVLGREKCIQIVYDILDFLFTALIDTQYYQLSLKEGSNESYEKLIAALEGFLSWFPLSSLSWKAYTQKFYYRSLFYLERNLAEEEKEERNLLPLKSIFTKLHDVDSLFGITKILRGTLSSEAAMLNDIVSGHLEDVVGAYERMAQKYSSTAYFRGLIQCYLNINQPYVALQLSKSFLSEKMYIDHTIYSEYIESLWAAGKFEDASEMLGNLRPEMKDGWSLTIDNVTVMDLIRKGQYDPARQKLNNMYIHLINDLSLIKNSSVGTYCQGYDIIVNLHVAYEMEKFVDIIELTSRKPSVRHQLDDFHQNLKIRSDLVRSFGGHVQEVLSCREKMFNLASHIANKNQIWNIEQYLRKSLGDVIVELARLARKNGNVHVACTKLSVAEKFKVSKHFIEKAKYHRAKCETEAAIIVLKQGIDDLQKEDSTHTGRHRSTLIAKAKLLIAKYNEENMNVDYNECVKNYTEAINAYDLEKSYVYLANFLHRAYQEDHEPDTTLLKRNRQVQSAENYSKSLLYGCKYVYQSMSCILNLWLDFGARFMKENKSKPCSTNIGGRGDTMDHFTSIITTNMKQLPSYLFMTSFSLILARVNHPAQHCYRLLQKIIVNIIRDYPQQAMWTVVSYYNSSDEGHKVRINEVLVELQGLNIECLNKFVKAFWMLVDVLIHVCNKQIVDGNKRTLPISSVAKCLKKMNLLKGTEVMIPIQKCRTISLPNYKYCKGGLGNEHNPFPTKLVYFADVKDDVLILHSIQRPKKLDFIGSDGQSYPMLCKSEDDLRLDSRIMEFNSLVNMCLARHPSSHDRSLHIRTYSVVPLNYKCGLIEWLPNLVTYKGAILSIYHKFGISYMKLREIRQCITGPDDPLGPKLKLFQDILLPKHPPFLHKWFFEQFSKAHSWYLARRAFVHTCAVMSIIGHIIGLGDRHGENILIDTTNGEVVHVDFNCVFDKGEKFAYPEVVPFRLTHNMVRAFGTTGVEGAFIRCCEIVSKVTRANSDQLLSIMKPFLYYDVQYTVHKINIEWIYFNQAQQLNERALQNILLMQKKLLGAVRLPGGIITEAFSVEGQVRCLVNEAMNPANLCRMYHGWGSFL